MVNRHEVLGADIHLDRNLNSIRYNGIVIDGETAITDHYNFSKTAESK